MEEDFKKVNLIELLRTLKKEGLDNFIVIRKENFKKFIPISVIQNKIDELKIAGVTRTLNDENELIEEHYFLQDEIDVLQELLEERNR